MNKDVVIKKISKTVNFVFLFSSSLILGLLSLGSLVLTPEDIVNFLGSYSTLVLTAMFLVLFLQLLSKASEYLLVERTRFLRRQLIVAVFLLVLLVFVCVFKNLVKVERYEEWLLIFSIPVFVVCFVGIVTFANVVRVFYIYPSLLFIIAAGVMIVVSAILLHLPISSATGEPIPLIDTLFVATSAVSCTGLTTVSVGKELSLIGQIILMITIQLGGLLIIFISTVGILFGLATGDAILRLRMASFFETKSTLEIQRLIGSFFLIAFSSQVIVALLIYPYFFEVERDEGRALFYSVFHVVSALNNAGFSTYDDSLVRFNNYPGFLLSIAYLILLGNTSIVTVTEVFSYVKTKVKNFVNLLLRRKKLEVFSFSLFSKIILLSHLTLIVVGVIAFFIFEGDHFLAQVDYPLVDALFNSISFRTAGFASFDFSQAKDSTYLFFSILMFIGGGSISVAGGVKMNTVALFVIALVAFLRSYPHLYFLRKEIDYYSLIRASAVIVGAIIILMGCIFIFYEFVREERFSKIIFELTSAFGTVGTSSGLTGKNLSTPAKLVLIFLMFSGKIGLITVLSIFAVRVPRYVGVFPRERIVVG